MRPRPKLQDRDSMINSIAHNVKVKQISIHYYLLHIGIINDE